MKTLNVLGIRIDAVTMEDVLASIHEAIQTKANDRYLLVVNVAKLIKAREDTRLRKIISEADIVAVDGMPLVWYSRLLPERLPEKVSGIDIMMNMFTIANSKGWSFYFLGGTATVIQKVVDRFREQYPGASTVGFHNGYFREEEEREIVKDIRNSGANILLIGFGSPKKEMFVERWRGSFGVNVVHGVGGSLDIYAGLTRRAPHWMQRTGLEWSYRLLQEPIRLFPRYAVTNSKFLVLLLRERLGMLRPL